MVQLENDLLIVKIHPLGAELQGLYRKDLATDYLWSGDPAYWGKYSPVLFPIVGTLRDNRYEYANRAYTMTRHGFARDKIFEVLDRGTDFALFSLQDDADTLEKYPFHFQLQLRYQLNGSRLQVQYSVMNTGNAEMFFSIGAHPAFAVPIEANLQYEDYRLVFDQEEKADRWTLRDGLLDGREPFLQDEHSIALTRNLFAKDALVFKGLRSSKLTLLTDASPRGWQFGIEGWPHLGIWAAPGAPFVCIEPWQGHADPWTHDGRLENKPGMLKLAAGETWGRGWWVDLY